MPRGGFKRSRALWDATREPQKSLVDTLRVWIQVICYELQPVRMNNVNITQWWNVLQALGKGIWNGICSTPSMARSIWEFLKTRSQKEWMIVAAVVGYYFIIRWIHEMLDAGPIVLIITCLVGIFTVGLGDDEDRVGLSAYSVFNRGFERLLGSVDAEALLAQHVGGGFGGVGAVLPNNHNHNHNNRFEDDNNNRVARRHHNPNGRQRDGPPGDGAAAAAAAADNNGNNNNDDDNNNNNNRSRKSGKKARRRNLEERRELRQQREAAVALGMHGDETQEEMMAMQRLIEEQLAAQNNDNPEGR